MSSRIRRRAAAGRMVAAACLLAAAVQTAPAGAGDLEVVQEAYSVKTRHGNIYVEVARPVDGTKNVAVPAILTYSPYSVLGRNTDAEQWVAKGYARVWADVVGTGNSGGCYDYGGAREKETGFDLVEWIADQKWSDGKVAMIGGSYNGTTAIATAVKRPPHLVTIVPEAAISRWYEYAYSGGIRYFMNNEVLSHQGPAAVTDEGFDTPLAFDFGLAVPPPLDVASPDWAERVESTVAPCDEIEHTEHGYDDTPDYDKFWRERDYIRGAGAIDIPVLIAHNWGDWNVKQEEAVNLFRALDNSPKRVLYMGTRWDGHGVPGGDYAKTVEAWFDHYLKSKDNGVQDLPDVISQMNDSEGARDWYAGRWPNTGKVTLIAQNVPPASPADYQWKLLPQKPVVTTIPPSPVAQFPSAGINTEAHANHHARSNHDWFWFETPILKRNTRIFGEIKVKLYSTVYREWVTMTPTIVDVDPGDHVTVAGQHVNTDPSALVSVTRGFLDSRYRKSLAEQKMLEPGRPFAMTIVEKPQDYTFKAGHYIGLNIQTEINEWMVPKHYPGCNSSDQQCAFFRIDWKEGKTKLILPIVGAPKNPMSLFDMSGHEH